MLLFAPAYKEVVAVCVVETLSQPALHLTRLICLGLCVPVS